jgi:hypothetical protein
MTSNSQLIRKADMVVSDLTSNGGYLNPEQSNAFIRKLLAAPTMLAQVRRVTMASPIRKINKISFASRILQPGAGGTGVTTLGTGDTTTRSAPTTEQIILQTHEVIAIVYLPYDVIEDNIEGGNVGTFNEGGNPPMAGGFRDTIVTLIAERTAIDLEEQGLQGDTNSSDPYLRQTDGFLKLIQSNIVDAGGDTISRTILKNGMKTLPSQYRRNRASLSHFLSTEQEIDYRDTIANRETSLGDAQLQSTAPVYAAGSPVQGVPLMPGSTGFLTNPLNLIFGVQRDIMMETDKIIKDRMYIIVVTARIAIQIEEELACVKYIGLAT